MKTLVSTVAAAALLAGAVGVASANAGVVFSDNFNSYGYQLNWAPPANWAAPGPGTVDLIGETTTATAFDFFPGNGGYVDLDGSNGVAGTLQTLASFGAGTYKLTFDLGGNARGDVAKTTVVSLGDFSQSVTLSSGAPLALETFTFKTTGGQLSFADLAGGNQNIGNILDNVSLSAVPEPATWAVMLVGFGGLGLAMRNNRRKLANAAAA
jgi:hypothetical protein